MKRLVVVGLPVAFALAGVLACKSVEPLAPAPESDRNLAGLTQWLNLDLAQQEKTRQLLEDLYRRSAQIHESWSKGGRVHTEQLMASSVLFQRDFVAILTVQQKQLYASTKLKLRLRMTGAPPRSRGNSPDGSGGNDESKDRR